MNTDSPVDFNLLFRQIDRAMAVDRFALRRQLDSLQAAARQGREFETRLLQWQEKLDASKALLDWRRTHLPKPKYDETLPVCQRRQEIAEAIQRHQVVILCGETGSGKSTQLPKICMELGRGVKGLIGHTQPRRLAARSIAARIAEELGSPLGKEVGYKVRFAEEMTEKTFVQVMTDGILLVETQSDPRLEKYDTIIIDEAHERSLNIDFLIGIMKRLLSKRPDLKLIITSATLDAERFAAHFPDRKGTPAPVIRVSGRTYPVDILWHPPELDAEGEMPEPDEFIADAVEEAASFGHGDILVFLPTERDIHSIAKVLRGRNIPGDGAKKSEILPLYARLSISEQQKIFQKANSRRIVLSTNVAESSLTVPGIRYVIDPGTVRISRYSARTKTQRLPIEAISQASADQRAGRCGRVGPGICIRLYSKEDYTNRQAYTAPEILRSNLASVILQTKAFRLGAVETFPFLEPPRPEAIRDGYKTLHELGAIDPIGELTTLGRQLAKLPVDPRIGRIICAAEEYGCLSDALIIASVLELQDPRERPHERASEADSQHAIFNDPMSDFLSYLKLWDFYGHLRQTCTRNQLHKACVQRFLNANRMREWSDILIQLREIAIEAKMDMGVRLFRYDASGTLISFGDAEKNTDRLPLESHAIEQKSTLVSDAKDFPQTAAQRRREAFNQRQREKRAAAETRKTEKSPLEVSSTRGKLPLQATASNPNDSKQNDMPQEPKNAATLLSPEKTFVQAYQSLHTSILTGFLSNIAMRGEGGFQYSVGGGGKAMLWPGSGLFHDKPTWCVAAELVETTNRYLRTAAKIQPAWIEPIAEHLIRKSYSNVRWSGDSGSAVATEKVTLYGLPIVNARTVRYGKIDPKQSRSLMIQCGLVDGEWCGHEDFYTSNQKLIEETERLEAKLRTRGLLCDDSERFNFYAERVPEDVFDSVTLTKWLTKIERTQPRFLYMTREDLLRENAEDVSTAKYPDTIELDTMKLPLEYRFEPGEKGDGITLAIPLEALHHLDSRRLGWIVPGLLNAKVEAMIRSLPKSYRVRFVPVHDTVRIITSKLLFGHGDFNTELAAALSRLAGITIPATAFDETKIPEPLKLNVRVLGGDGKTVAENRDLTQLRSELGEQSSATFAEHQDPRWSRSGLRTWEVDEFPSEITIRRSGLVLKAFPMLVDDGDSVSLSLAEQLERAERETRQGIRRLFTFAASRELTSQTQWFPKLNECAVWASTIRGFNLRKSLPDLIAARALDICTPIPRSRQAFEECVQKARPRIPMAVQELSGIIPPLFEFYHRTRLLLDACLSISRWSESTQDIATQLSEMVKPTFFTEIPWEWFRHLPRYLKGMTIRLEALKAGGGQRDREGVSVITPLWNQYIEKQEWTKSQGVFDPELLRYRWMLEEYRISIFAQRLGTAVSVSPKRLAAQWEKTIR